MTLTVSKPALDEVSPPAAANVYHDVVVALPIGSSPGTRAIRLDRRAASTASLWVRVADGHLVRLTDKWLRVSSAGTLTIRIVGAPNAAAHGVWHLAVRDGATESPIMVVLPMELGEQR